MIYFILLFFLFLKLIFLYIFRKNQKKITTLIYNQEYTISRLEKLLHHDIEKMLRLYSLELNNNSSKLQQTLSSQFVGIINIQNKQLDVFINQFEIIRKVLQNQKEEIRNEQRIIFKDLSETINSYLSKIIEINNKNTVDLALSLEKNFNNINKNNSEKLEEIRCIVNEKLHDTLERRLGDSFKIVSDKLEQVYRALGEIRILTENISNLKKVLSNIKTRGIWGEVQLESILSEILTSDQYAKNVSIIPNSRDRVEFAVKLPGYSCVNNTDNPVWLPIDSKFPLEDYDRLIDAQNNSNQLKVEEAYRSLESRISAEAQVISKKYLSPPNTTDFAILFLPTEGLYAEILRRPGLANMLQKKYRVIISGPTTLTALLNSLQMGFRTLAIEKRSSEVWQVLGSVKTEFYKFSEILSKTKSQLETITRSIAAAEVRTRVMNKKLVNIELFPEN